MQITVLKKEHSCIFRKCFYTQNSLPVIEILKLQKITIWPRNIFCFKKIYFWNLNYHSYCHDQKRVKWAKSSKSDWYLFCGCISPWSIIVMGKYCFVLHNTKSFNLAIISQSKITLHDVNWRNSHFFTFYFLTHSAILSFWHSFWRSFWQSLIFYTKSFW